MRRAQVAIGVISFISVYLITCQLRSVDINKNIETPEKLRVDELQNMLVSEKEKNADLLSQLVESQRNLESYRTDASNTSAVNTVMKKELDNAQILAGTTELEGSGVTVTVSDSSLPSSEISGNVESYIVHDGDLRMILTELYGAGAEAVSVNGQRIVATTAVRCVGNTIMVNDVKIATPFEIKAIGDPSTLEAALMIKGGVSDYLKSWGINLTVKKEDKVDVPRYAGAVSFKYAQQVTEGGDAK
jgi:uncharacterized protein YlxW (UPF0749 family)